MRSSCTPDAGAVLETANVCCIDQLCSQRFKTSPGHTPWVLDIEQLLHIALPGRHPLCWPGLLCSGLCSGPCRRLQYHTHFISNIFCCISGAFCRMRLCLTLLRSLTDANYLIKLSVPSHVSAQQQSTLRGCLAENRYGSLVCHAG